MKWVKAARSMGVAAFEVEQDFSADGKIVERSSLKVSLDMRDPGTTIDRTLELSDGMPDQGEEPSPFESASGLKRKVKAV